MQANGLSERELDVIEMSCGVKYYGDGHTASRALEGPGEDERIRGQLEHALHEEERVKATCLGVAE